MYNSSLNGFQSKYYNPDKHEPGSLAFFLKKKLNKKIFQENIGIASRVTQASPIVPTK